MVESTVLLCLSLVELVGPDRFADQNPPWRSNVHLGRGRLLLLLLLFLMQKAFLFPFGPGSGAGSRVLQSCLVATERGSGTSPGIRGLPEGPFTGRWAPETPSHAGG